MRYDSKPLCPVCLGRGRLKVMMCTRCNGTGTVKPNPYSPYSIIEERKNR